MKNAATKTNPDRATGREERKERLLQTLEDWAAPPLLILLGYIVPFAVPFAVLHFLGAPWWVSVPLAWILLPFVRSGLFGPPCRCVHHRGKKR